ncbi:MAG TPA: Nif3-like dinuclear metal center hexameric protein [Firmicutes bacterium]|nr:Nif3-like dinuclear metal center hexameric protein [Bacillota bacterium]
MDLKSLTGYLDTYLKIAEISDSSQNGLQVEMSGPVKRLGLAVDASEAAFRMGKKKKVDLIIVHHGLFWGKPFTVTDLYYNRISLLIKNNIGLYASHLPLDMHPEVGNNVQIARLLNLSKIKEFGEYHGNYIGVTGFLEKALCFSDFMKLLIKTFKSGFNSMPFGKKRIRKVGIVSGGGSSMIRDAVLEDADVFITGEVSHGNFHSVKEYKINLVTGGHYFTETFGVKSLGEHLRKKFGLQIQFLDIPTGL